MTTEEVVDAPCGYPAFLSVRKGNGYADLPGGLHWNGMHHEVMG